MKFEIVENAKSQAVMLLKGIAIPSLIEIPDSQVMDDVDYVYGVGDHKRYLVTEKILEFNRKSLKKVSKSKGQKKNRRYGGGADTMIVKVGKPGSRERVEALRSQYEAIMACGEEVSPFAWKE